MQTPQHIGQVKPWAEDNWEAACSFHLMSFLRGLMPLSLKLTIGVSHWRVPIVLVWGPLPPWLMVNICLCKPSLQLVFSMCVNKCAQDVLCRNLTLWWVSIFNCVIYFLWLHSVTYPRATKVMTHSGELRTQKLKSHLVRTELKRSPFQAWSRSVSSHMFYTYCQGLLPCLFLPFQSIHLHFFQNLSQFFPVLACRIK